MPVVESPNLIGTDSPKSGPSKAVTIAEPESMSPLLRSALTSQESANNLNSQSHRQHRASGARRLSGRPSYKASTSSLNSQASASSSAKTDYFSTEEAAEPQVGRHHGHHGLSHRQLPHPHRLVSQILEWLHVEKQKQARKLGSTVPGITSNPQVTGDHETSHENDPHAYLAERIRRLSEVSDGSLALERLEQILAENMVIDSDMLRTSTKESRPPPYKKKSLSIRKPRKSTAGPSSDTDYQEGDIIVPSADVVLDNSKTMGYSGGATSSTQDLSLSHKRVAKEKEGWLVFKTEIVKLAHTLRLKGWRRVSMDSCEDIEVERLSGALTNAVYVVFPPKELLQPQADGKAGSAAPVSKRRPKKLLLRVYGPQVEHLIDRESELQILRRLARKKIGPRLLGTFINGRFEEFFNAQTLTAADLRNPETSKQIAKRMRELHDGIELLEEERDAGPFIWRNWDKWVARCEEVITWLDHQILCGEAVPSSSHADEWKARGLVCGVEWTVFRKTVEKYRKWLDDQYGGPQDLRQHLVFAHNDTQYGNLLRIEPSGESPLLLPANEHKQLVVIDFEYASANVRGLEFANHFTEWCYNYHSPTRAYACNTSRYPSLTEQHRFLKSYVQHRPQFHPSASATPDLSARPAPSSSISSFMLDSRAMHAPQTPYAEEEKKREEMEEKEIQRLMRETRLWRVANSAQWVAWGVVQAKVRGMNSALASGKKHEKLENATVHQSPASTSQDPTPIPSPATAQPLSPSDILFARAADKRPEGLVAEALAHGQEPPQEDDEEEGFDYLGYAQERALFFWGDVLSLGIVDEEVLPVEVRGRVKRVEY